MLATSYNGLSYNYHIMQIPFQHKLWRAVVFKFLDELKNVTHTNHGSYIKQFAHQVRPQK